MQLVNEETGLSLDVQSEDIVKRTWGRRLITNLQSSRKYQGGALTFLRLRAMQYGLDKDSSSPLSDNDLDYEEHA